MMIERLATCPELEVIQQELGHYQKAIIRLKCEVQLLREISNQKESRIQGLLLQLKEAPKAAESLALQTQLQDRELEIETQKSALKAAAAEQLELHQVIHRLQSQTANVVPIEPKFAKANFSWMVGSPLAKLNQETQTTIDVLGNPKGCQTLEGWKTTQECASSQTPLSLYHTPKDRRDQGTLCNLPSQLRADIVNEYRRRCAQVLQQMRALVVPTIEGWLRTKGLNELLYASLIFYQKIRVETGEISTHENRDLPFYLRDTAIYKVNTGQDLSKIVWRCRQDFPLNTQKALTYLSYLIKRGQGKENLAGNPKFQDLLVDVLTFSLSSWREN